MSFLKRYRLDLLICLLLLLFLAPLFFYKLGVTSLQDWDEAWYAEISRNILKTGDIFNLRWAGFPYFDHPNFGFVMTALSFKLFGISEFTARFMSALFGLASVVIIFLLGKELFNRWVGVLSALALPSATWFLYRARSGNLDVYLETLFLLTLYLAWKANQNKRLLVPFTISLSCLFLTKTMVPFTIIPALLIIFWKNHQITKKDLQINALIFIIIVGSWFVNQLAHQMGFISRYFGVGLPGVEVKTDLLANLKQAKDFLHNGIGKWFWPGMISLFLSIPMKQKRFLILTVFFLSFFIPFIFSKDGGIWHLVPLHPILILAFFGFAFVLLEKFPLPPQGRESKLRSFLVVTPLFLICLYFSFIQIKRSWYEFIDVNPYTSNEASLSKEASRFNEDLYIEGSDFRPAAVFYSDKDVPQRLYKEDLPRFFASTHDFLLITYPQELKDEQISQSSYKIIKSDGDKVLIWKEH